LPGLACPCRPALPYPGRPALPCPTLSVTAALPLKTGSAIKNAAIRLVITATDSAIENAAPRLFITATGSAIENAEAGSAGELKCRIVVSDRRTDYLNLYIRLDF